MPGLQRSSVPVLVPSLREVVQVRCNQARTCARTRDGRVFCWGDDDTMSPEPGQSLPPTEVAGLAGASDLWVLPNSVCAIVAGAVRCDGLMLDPPADPQPAPSRHLRFVPTPQRALKLCVVSAEASGIEEARCLAGREVPRQGARPRPPVAPKAKAQGVWHSDSAPVRPIASGPSALFTPTPPAVPPVGAGPLQGVAFFGGSLCRFYASGPVCDPVLLSILQGAQAGSLRPQVLAVSEDVLCLRRDGGDVGCATWMGSRLAAGGTVLGPLRALALGESHACAVLGNGTLRCWGEASHGELGDGISFAIATPQRVFQGAVELAVADDLSCARRADGQVHCWGVLRHCDVDERCERSVAPSLITTPEPSLRLAVASPLSTRRLCSQGAAGWACRFGEWVALPRLPVPLDDVAGGLLGRDGRTWDWAPSNPPERPRPHFFALAGQRLTRLSPDGYCGINERQQVLCGQCGMCAAREARNILTTLAAPPAALTVSHMISDGGSHGVCVVAADGRVSCIDLDGAPWRRAEMQRPLLADVTANLRDVQAVALADDYGAGLRLVGCFLGRDGVVRCFGNNADGQLGDGSRVSRRLPARVIGIPPATAIGVGRDHACALTASGDVYCWGSARRGAVGTGQPVFRETPVAVAAVGSSAGTRPTTAP